MASYFDPSDTADLAYLSEGLRTATNLSLHASAAEADVINHYTDVLRPGMVVQVVADDETGRTYTDLGDGRGVFLEHYEVDSDDCESTAFLAAMKRTVADVIAWRLEQDQRERAVTSVSTGRGIAKGFTPGHASPFPPNWGRWLRTFDTREPAWGV